MKDYIIIGILLIFLFLYYLSNSKSIEGFSNINEKYNSEELYDLFYSKVYDQLFYSEPKLNFETTQIKKNTFNIKQSKIRILDIGCGTGQHLNRFKDYNIIGLDRSNDMLQVAKKKCKNIRLIKGDASIDSELFEDGRFTHIFSLYFVIYYQKDLNSFLQNCYNWLKPGGFLIVHIVNPLRFDPILDPASPFPGFSLQKYSNKRITKSNVYFNNFEYESNFILNPKNIGYFKEIFKFKNRIRQQTHKFYMFPIEQMVKKINSNGFEYVNKTDLLHCGYEYQYLYYFTKK